MISEYTNRLSKRLKELNEQGIDHNKDYIGYFISSDLEIRRSSYCSINSYKFEHPHTKEELFIETLKADGCHNILWYLTKEEAVKELLDILNSIKSRYEPISNKEQEQ